MLVVGCFLVKSCRLITLIKYLKGHKYLGLLLKGIVHQFFFFYCSNLIFWIVMGCGIADFGRRSL